MKERPILFSTPMVQALLEGRKSQTRRIVKPQPHPFTQAMRDIPQTNRWWAAYKTENDFGTEFTPLPHDWQHDWKCPYGVVGDRLWVRELHWRWGKWIKNGLTKTGRAKWTFFSVGNSVRYAENAPKTTAKRDGECGWVYRHGRFMFSAHSRMTLEITDVRVERLQDISEEDAKAEGVEPATTWVAEYGIGPYVAAYSTLWDSINGEDSWALNPFVFALTFRRIDERT